MKDAKRKAAHLAMEILGVGSIIAGAAMYDVRVGLILFGLACLKATTTGGLKWPGPKEG